MPTYYLDLLRVIKTTRYVSQIQKRLLSPNKKIQDLNLESVRKLPFPVGIRINPAFGCPVSGYYGNSQMNDVLSCFKILILTQLQLNYITWAWNYVFFVSALFRNCLLRWECWNSTWLLHMTRPCYVALGRVLIWVVSRIGLRSFVNWVSSFPNSDIVFLLLNDRYTIPRAGFDPPSAEVQTSTEC